MSGARCNSPSANCVFLIPSLLIALPLFWPRRTATETPVAAADDFDRRIVALLAFGPMATVLALSAVSGRGTVAMWGYPLWLFVGVWLVLIARRALDDRRLGRILITWAVVFAGLAIAFIGNYGVLPHYDHRYRAVFFPGGDLGREISQRTRAITGQPVAYVIGSMWDGRQCRALFARPSARADRRQTGTRALDRSRRSQAPRRSGAVDRRRSANRAAGIPHDRTRRRRAAAVLGAVPARRSGALCRLGDSAAEAVICERNGEIT
ncbi:MAG: hypothetical protein WDN48_18215 [Pseudolabrys sp.]